MYAHRYAPVALAQSSPNEAQRAFEQEGKRSLRQAGKSQEQLCRSEVQLRHSRQVALKIETVYFRVVDSRSIYIYIYIYMHILILLLIFIFYTCLTNLGFTDLLRHAFQCIH